MTTDAKKCVVSIVATSYAGSTWLNLMLGSHSQAFSVGELKSLVKHDTMACMLDGASCPFWNQIDLKSETNIYQQIFDLTGKQYLFVTNSLTYFPVPEDMGFDHKIIHVVRDGRAVSASIRRKGDEQWYHKAVFRWRRNVRRNHRLLRQLSHLPQRVCMYESALHNTTQTLKTLCDFVGMAYEPAMEEYWEREHHYLAGNRGTLFSMASKKQTELPEDPRSKGGKEKGPDWDLDFYKKSDPQKFQDDRWKKQLSRRDLWIFNLIAGRLNRKLGY